MSAETHIFEPILSPNGSTTIPSPPLPAIKDDKLRRLVFTHKSARTAQVSSQQDLSAEQCDYEKFAHVGDALLGCAVVLLPHQLFPKMSQGAATKLKEKLVDESALDYLSRRYALQNHLRAPASALQAILASSRSVAEIFEAYIAAIFYDNIKPSMEDGQISHSPGFSAGFSAVLDFLIPLYTPLAKGLYDPSDLTEEEEDKKAEGAMGKLHSWLGVRKAGLPNYEPEMHVPPGAKGESGKYYIVTCTVYYRTKVWSTTAKRSAVVKAKNVAAWKAMEQMRNDADVRGF